MQERYEDYSEWYSRHICMNYYAAASVWFRLGTTWGETDDDIVYPPLIWVGQAH